MSADFEAMGIFGRERQPLSRIERMDARRHLSTLVAQGSISASAASLILNNSDAWMEYQQQIATLRSSAEAAGGGKIANLFNFLVSHFSQIYAILSALLKTFFPTFPPLPPLPTPTPTPSPVVPPVVGPPSPVVNPPPFTPPASLTGGAGDDEFSHDPVGFALPYIPPFLQQLLLSWMIGAIQKIGPEIASNIPAAEAWLEEKLKKTFGG